ncbi:MAG: MotA/TolQ/ExbB proton channel family protein [Kiritimatiellia bacterium]
MIAAASADVSSAQGPTSEVDVALSGSDTNVVAAIEGEVAPTPEKTALDQWVTWCIQGGRTMIFLGALSILGLGCALERAFNLRLKRIVPEGFSSKIVSLWRDDKIDEVRAVCAKDRSMLARVVETMLEHAESTDFQEVKMFAEDKASRELRLENRKSAMLATVATLSPLLGLFGTVVGLLGAFTTVAAVGEMGNPAILADDISKALITTVAGLAISMPALFMHNIIKHRLGLYAVILEEEVSDLVHNLFIRISH